MCLGYVYFIYCHIILTPYIGFPLHSIKVKFAKREKQCAQQHH